MHGLRGYEFAKNSISSNLQYLISELFSEIYDSYPNTEDIKFPSDELLDMLKLHDGIDRRVAIKSLNMYAVEISSLWEEYSLMNLMIFKLYLNCSITPMGDLLLTQTPASI